eukprot:764457-Hanusia_phi.AAC.4
MEKWRSKRNSVRALNSDRKTEVGEESIMLVSGMYSIAVKYHQSLLSPLLPDPLLSPPPFSAPLLFLLLPDSPPPPHRFLELPGADALLPTAPPLLGASERVSLPPHKLAGLEEVLLISDHASRSHNPQPSHRLICRQPMLPHHPQGDQRPRPAQPGEAVNRDFGLALADFEEGGDDVWRGDAAVLEEEVVVADAGVCEGLGRVPDLVEPHDGGNLELLEDRQQLERPVIEGAVAMLHGALEGDELGTELVQVGEERIVELVVPGQVELGHAEPAALGRLLHAPHAALEVEVVV